MTKSTLFLDRDGVINVRKPGAYLSKPEEFVFSTGFLESAKWLAENFDQIIVLTNQQGIGKKLMTHSDLWHVHEFMLAAITGAGGRIDRIYYCPHLATENCTCRKPATGLADLAKENSPAIDFSQSVLVGDSLSDLILGAKLGCKNIWMDTKEEDRKAIRKKEVEDQDFYINGTILKFGELQPLLEIFLET